MLAGARRNTKTLTKKKKKTIIRVDETLAKNISALLVLLSASPTLLFLGDKYLALGIMLGSATLSFVPAHRIKKEIKSRMIFSVGEMLHKGMPVFLTIM